MLRIKSIVTGDSCDVINLQARCGGQVISDNKVLLEVIQQLAQSRDIAAAQSVVKTAACRLLGADGAIFVLKKNEAYCRERQVTGKAESKYGPDPVDSCIGGWCMEHNQAAIIENIADSKYTFCRQDEQARIGGVAMVPMRGQYILATAIHKSLNQPFAF